MKKLVCQKCEVCEYGDISNIQMFDCVVQKCSKCGIVRVSARGYSKLMYNILYSLDIGGIRSYTTAGDFNEKTIKTLQKFIKIVDIPSFKLIDLESGTCNVCRSSIAGFTNRYYKFFKIYYCIGCNSIYFDKKELEDFMDFAKKVCEPFSFKKFLKEIFSFKKRKDNAKEQTVQPELLHKKNP